MFDRKGRVVLAAFLILVLVVPAVGVLAAGSGGNQPAAAPAATPLTWTQVYQAPAGQFFYTMHWVNRNVGYAVSGPDWNNDATKNDPTYVYKTTDGGKNWTKIDPGIVGFSRGITCSDENNCWVIGKLPGRSKRTTNGGSTWTLMSNQSGYTHSLWSGGWTGQGQTILAGTTGYDPTTSDGYNANWLRAPDGQTFQASVGLEGTKTLWVQWDFDCPTPGYCYSAGKDYIWRTTNNAASWTRAFAGALPWRGVSCTSPANCWISGKGSPYIKYSTANGTNWLNATVNGAGSATLLWDLMMVDSTHGYAVGCSKADTTATDACLTSQGGAGIIYRTDDGTTWNAIPSPAKADIMDVWAFSTEDVFIIDWSGKIWHGAGPSQGTDTPTPTATETASPTATATETPSPTATATETPEPTSTATETPEPTATETATSTPTVTSTPTMPTYRLYLPIIVN